MEKFNEIINTSYTELEEVEKEFVRTHEKILYYGKNVCENLFQMAKQLEYMKDNKIYLSAGFDSFESYCEDAVGLKRSQVYNYIKLANSYSDQFLLTNSNVGITKLLVLSELEEPVVEKVIETVNVDDTTVSELKTLVDSLTKEKKDLEKKNKEDSKSLKSEIKQLKEEIKKLKSDEGSSEEMDEENDDLNIEDELKEKNKRILELESLLQVKEEELQEVAKINTKTNLINSNPELIKFKVKFEQLQLDIKSLNDIIENLDEESKGKCINALNTVLRGAIHE